MRIKILAAVAFLAAFSISEAKADPNWTNTNCGIASLSGSSTTLVSKNPQLHYLLICNFGATNDNITLGMAGETVVANQGLVLVPGSCKEYASGSSYLPNPPANTITVIGTSGQPVSCYEGL